MEEQTAKKSSRMQKFLLRLFTCFLVLLLLCAFYLAVVMGDPNQDAVAAQTPESASAAQAKQQPLAAQPARTASQGESPSYLAASFPAPYLAMPPDSASFTFIGGQAYDSSFEGGFARIMALRYQTASGLQVQLTSIYPAHAFSILGREGYTLSGGSYSLAGRPAVRMDGPQGARIHIQGEKGLYALSVPAVSQEELGQLLRDAQLMDSPAHFSDQ